PAPVRAGLALFLALAIAPGVHAPFADVSGLRVVAALVRELVLGSAIGIAAAAIYDGAYAGGRAIDDYVGVRAVAPNVQLVAPSGYGRLWSLAFTGGFFLLGAYRYTLLGFARSFDVIPVGSGVDVHAWLPFAMRYADAVVAAGAAIAAPSIALAFVVQVALGALGRTIPRFASFTLSFPLVFGAALIATAIVISEIASRAQYPVVFLPAAP
ncbi:MAG: flagellar biosynthetic protein FliR, partial [Vulcanimicrobiaceae bacterium]